MKCLASKQIAFGSQGGHWLFTQKGYAWDLKEYGIWSKEKVYHCWVTSNLKPNSIIESAKE